MEDLDRDLGFLNVDVIAFEGECQTYVTRKSPPRAMTGVVGSVVEVFFVLRNDTDALVASLCARF